MEDEGVARKDPGNRSPPLPQPLSRQGRGEQDDHQGRTRALIPLSPPRERARERGKSLASITPPLSRAHRSAAHLAHQIAIQDLMHPIHEPRVQTHQVAKLLLLPGDVAHR